MSDTSGLIFRVPGDWGGRDLYLKVENDGEETVVVWLCDFGDEETLANASGRTLKEALRDLQTQTLKLAEVVSPERMLPRIMNTLGLETKGMEKTK